VPFGKALYVLILDDEDSALEESTAEDPGNETYQLINTLRSVDAAFVDATTSVFLSVDGVPVPDLMQRFRGQSTVFGFTLPPQPNVFSTVYGMPDSFGAGSYFPAADDGWAVMLAPLPRGNHVLHFGGVNPGLTADTTYHLTVQ
jgi:hypothetical protein